MVVNMDETMLSNVKERAKGVVADARRLANTASMRISRETAMPRTSLIAAICDDNRVQSRLPQLRLPRKVREHALSRPLRRAYCHARKPQMSLHGGSGWCNASIMTVWLRALKSAVAQAAPGRPLLLVMDDCSIHICDQVLLACVRLKIGVVIIPARMTWALQPLDTHVFCRLKGDIRKDMFETLAGENWRMGLVDKVCLHGVAIKRVLVDTDWSITMARAGLSSAVHELRPALKQLIGDANCSGCFPDEEQLQDILQTPRCRCPALSKALKLTVQAAASEAVDDAPLPPAAPRAAAMGGGLASLGVRLRLRSVARLPPAPGGSGASSSRCVMMDRHSPVVTRSRSSAAAE